MNNKPWRLFSDDCPTKILLQIFLNCHSLRGMAALIFTSRRLVSVWEEHHPVIIWHVGSREIPAFDRALMAVR